jgi:hypothetical protein
MTPGSASPLLLDAAGGYKISRSVRFRSSSTASFYRTFGSIGDRRSWTWSAWVKLGQVDFTTGDVYLFHTIGSSNRGAIRIETDASLTLYPGGTGGINIRTAAVFRDPSAWYHIVAVCDTPNATATDRLRYYINGVRQTLVSSTLPAQNYDGYININAEHNLGTYDKTVADFDGYMTEINFVGGQALTAASFGEIDPTTGVWKPKQYTGAYGTNGFYLNFSDNSAATAAAIGKDWSGSGNNWTPSNVSLTSGATYDSMIDTPTLYADGGNGRGNYPTLNSLQKSPTAFLSDGNLRLDPIGTGVGAIAKSTFGGNGGIKFYVEFNINSVGSGGNIVHCAICDSSSNPTLATFNGNFTYYRRDGSIDGTTYATYTSGDIIAAAVDTGANTVSWYKNNVLQVTRTSVSYDAYFAMFMVSDAGGSYGYMNFGQRPFAYTPPSGFMALNTQNLPAPPIPAGNKYFDASTYTGTGAALVVVNSGTMQPDLLWLKNRSLGAGGNHVVFDSVRGGPSNELYPNTTAAEAATTGALTSLNANGFTLGNAGDLVRYNSNGNSYVGWQWKKGATPGFDIVTYTGTGANRTVAHSLGVAPSMMIMKRRDNVGAWFVYHASQGATKYMTIDTAAATTSSTAWNNTAPTSSVFTVGTNNNVNGSSGTYVAYLFSEVAGFSKFGSYTGNGAYDGPFVYCGFKPRFILIKSSTRSGAWYIWDTVRNPINPVQLELYPNLTNAEATAGTGRCQIFANGFKLTDNDLDFNANGATQVFAAFAENPFKYALAR